MKTSKKINSVCLVLIASMFAASCGGGGGSQKIPGGRNNFSIELDQILEPGDGDTVACLQPSIEIQVPLGSLCTNPDEIRDSIYLVQKDTEDLIPLGVVTKKEEGDGYCVLETSPSSWLFPEETYVLSTSLDSSGSVILSGSESITFHTGTFAENRECNNAMKIVTNDNNWRKTYLFEQGKIDASGERQFDGDEFGDLFFDSITQIGLGTLLGLSTLRSNTPIVVPFNYEPSTFFFENHVIIKSLDRDDIEAYFDGELGDGGFQDVMLEDCDTDSGSCFEIIQDENQKWYLVIHPDNEGWQSGRLYFFVILESFRSKSGKFMNATYLRPEAR